MPPEEPKKRHFWRHRSANTLGSPAWVIFVTVAIFVISQVAAVLIVQSGLGALARKSGDINSSVTAQFFYVLIAEGLAAALAIYIVRRKKLSLAAIGLGRKPNWRDLRRGLGGFVIFYILIIIISAVLTLFYPGLDKGSQDVGFNNLKGGVDTLIAFFALVFLPPLGEETLVRGYLYSGLRRRLKFVPALIITSLLFGAAHLDTGAGPGVLWAAGVNTFVLSVVLVTLRESSGALYAGMLVHMLNNLIAFGVHYHF